MRSRYLVRILEQVKPLSRRGAAWRHPLPGLHVARIARRPDRSAALPAALPRSPLRRRAPRCAAALPSGALRALPPCRPATR